MSYWTAEQMKEAVEVAFKACHNGAAPTLSVQSEEGGWFVEIGEPGDSGIDPCSMNRKRLGGEEVIVPGYRVYYWKHHPATRDDPPDVSDETVLRTENPWEAAKKLALLDLENEIDLAFMTLEYRRRGPDF